MTPGRLRSNPPTPVPSPRRFAASSPLIGRGGTRPLYRHSRESGNPAPSAPRGILAVENIVIVAANRSRSNRFLVHADEMIRKGDRLQASEKIWGAVAHALKAVANERGWEHDGHQRLRNVALHLQDHPAVANPEIGTLLRSVEAFHRNFYNDNMAIDEIASGLVDAANLVRLLEAANAALPGDAHGPARRRAQ